MKVKLTLFISIILTMFHFDSASAQTLQLPRIFGDHMVLQRNADVRLWGWSEPNSNVHVQLGSISVETVATPEGSWEVFLPKQIAGGPHRLEISSDETISFDDVYFGDVWIAGGQSNMEWKLNWVVDGWEEEVANSDFPEIRFFEVPNTTSYKTEHDITGGEWMLSNPETSPNFSAIAWYFAKLNHTEKSVPVGIIDSNWGGTPAEAWTPAQRLLSTPGSEKEAQRVLDPNKDWATEFAQNKERETLKWDLIGSPKRGLAKNVHTTGFDDSNWMDVTLPLKKPLQDVVWLRKTFELDDSPKNPIVFHSGDIVQEAIFYLNGDSIGVKGWQDSNTSFNIDPSLFKKGTNLIAFRAVNSWDNNVMIGGKVNMELVIDEDRIDLAGDWKFSNEVEPKIPQPTRNEWQPGFLYNAMIHPIAGYSLKGAIWYQGENNVGNHTHYNKLFEAMIEEWRSAWGQGDFPFLYVQLANYSKKTIKTAESAWAALREAQTQTLRLNNTAMATIIDIGNADDIHPRNKKSVGYRLWLAALKEAYNQTDVVYSGPTYRSHSVEGNRMHISFDHIGSGLVVNNSDKVLGFALAGEDSKFHWAEANLDGNEIVIWSDKVSKPVFIRYAWSDNPDVSLYNKEGLPAVPFRTDN